MITFVCPGPQCSTNQGYATARGRRGMYLTAAGAEFKARIQIAARQAFRRIKPSTKEFEVRAVYYFKSKKSDCDGPSKFVLDSLEGIAYGNDSQVVRFVAEKKLDRLNPRTVIQVMELYEEA